MPLDDYEPVASRIQRFYAAYPNGAIHCDIIFDDGNRVVVKATIYRAKQNSWNAPGGRHAPFSAGRG